MSKSKGMRRERQAQKILKENGYRVTRAKNHMYGANDYFGLFDILAVHPEEKAKLIQVKSNGTGGELTRTGHRASVFVNPDHFDVEFWMCYDREGWRVLRLEPADDPTDADWETVVDERGRGGNMGVHVPEVL